MSDYSAPENESPVIEAGTTLRIPEQAYGGRPKGGPATDAAPTPAPTMPADVVAALIPFMQRVELTGDEAYAYVRAMTYLRSQKELHQKLKRATE